MHPQVTAGGERGAVQDLGDVIGHVGLGLVVMLSLLYLGHIDRTLRTAAAAEAAAEAQHAACLDPRVSLQALVSEPAGWLNAMLVSGWESALRAYVTELARETIDASLVELELPKTFRSVRLQDLSLGSRPPFVRSVACIASAGPSPQPRDGCTAQADVDWEAPTACATLAFQLANVASQPRLRLRRARLRGTVRLHWEWIPTYPYIGRLKCSFVRPPEVSDIAVEPLGNVDVTSLPGIGTLVRDGIRESIHTQLCLPQWVETDVRTTAAAAAAAAKKAAIREYQKECAVAERAAGVPSGLPTGLPAQATASPSEADGTGDAAAPEGDKGKAAAASYPE